MDSWLTKGYRLIRGLLSGVELRGADMWDAVVHAWTYLIKITGIPIDPGPAAVVTVGVVVTGKALWAMRRSRREFKRIAAELNKATDVISKHMRTEFDGQVDKMNKL